MIQSPAVTSGSFTAAVQFEKLEIHKVFLRFQTFICGKISRWQLLSIKSSVTKPLAKSKKQAYTKEKTGGHWYEVH